MKPIRIFPHGLATNSQKGRPVMIFKDKKEKLFLPILFEHWEGKQVLDIKPGNAIEFRGGLSASVKILEALNAELDSVYFDEIGNQGLRCLVTVKKGDERIEVRLNSSEVLALALFAGAVFWTNENIVEKSKELYMEWLMNMNSMGNLEKEKEIFGVH